MDCHKIVWKHLLFQELILIPLIICYSNFVTVMQFLSKNIIFSSMDFFDLTPDLADHMFVTTYLQN